MKKPAVGSLWGAYPNFRANKNFLYVHRGGTLVSRKLTAIEKYVKLT